MQKLPGLAVIRRSYRFLLEEFGTVVRLSWFPLLIVTIAQYFASRTQLQVMIAAAEAGDIQMMMSATQAQWQALLSVLVAVVGGAIVAVAIHRVVLFGDRKPGTFIHLAFGKVEVLFIVIPLAGLVLWMLVLAPVLLSDMARGIPPGPGLLSAAVAVLVIVGFLAIRFSMLWPMAVVEERYAFRESFGLSEGNFWRLLGTLFLGILPLGVVLVVAMLSLGIGIAPDVRSLADLLALLNGALDRLPIQSAVTYAVSILMGAIGVALLSYSYKALKGYGPDDLVS